MNVTDPIWHWWQSDSMKSSRYRLAARVKRAIRTSLSSARGASPRCIRCSEPTAAFMGSVRRHSGHNPARRHRFRGEDVSVLGTSPYSPL